MERWIKRTVVVTGLGIAAFFGGQMLGRFTVAGLIHRDQPVNGAGLDPVFPADALADNGAKPPNASEVADAASGAGNMPQAYNCTGCDAHVDRDADPLASLPSADAGQEPGDGVTADDAAPAPVRPRPVIGAPPSPPHPDIPARPQ